MTTPYHTTGQVTLHLGDSLDILPTLPDTSIDAIVTDPPYELGFMGRAWDASGIAYNVDLWRECLRVLKPGGHLAAFGGTRTYHRMTVAIEDAGFEIRDSLHWIYGSGFPKSLDVSKAIDKAAGAQRKVVGDKLDRPGYHLSGHDSGTGALGRGISATSPETRLRAAQITAPATESASRWQGWGTALKPAHEPIVLARKPLTGTVAGSVLARGTGALNIDASRISSAEPLVRPAIPRTDNAVFGTGLGAGTQEEPVGRWPTNVILTHPPLVDEHGEPIGDACAGGCIKGCPVAELDQQSGVRPSGGSPGGASSNKGMRGNSFTRFRAEREPDSGGASRFFPVFRYEAKAPARERPRLPDGTAHPTVKPLALMRWLVRLVTPPGGTVLEPFAGSGTTLEAAALEGFTVVGVERDEQHAELCRVRLSKPLPTALFGDIA